MIRINLLGEEKEADGSGGIFVGSWAAGLLGLIVCFFVTQSILGSSLENSKMESARLNTELARLKKITAEVEQLEKMRKDLRSKLAVIARLKLNKSGPVRVLDDLNIAIPERAWILTAQEKADEMKIDGLALDNQTTAEFMTNLEKSEYFQKVELLETKQIEQKGVKINAFSIKAKVNYSGKIGKAPEEAPVTNKRGKA